MSDRTNTFATKEQLQVLQIAYSKSARAAGPALKALSEETGLEAAWITRWFYRQRNKNRKKPRSSVTKSSASDSSDEVKIEEGSTLTQKKERLSPPSDTTVLSLPPPAIVKKEKSAMTVTVRRGAGKSRRKSTLVGTVDQQDDLGTDVDMTSSASFCQPSPLSLESTHQSRMAPSDLGTAAITPAQAQTLSSPPEPLRNAHICASISSADAKGSVYAASELPTASSSLDPMSVDGLVSELHQLQGLGSISGNGLEVSRGVAFEAVQSALSVHSWQAVSSASMPSYNDQTQAFPLSTSHAIHPHASNLMEMSNGFVQNSSVYSSPNLLGSNSCFTYSFNDSNAGQLSNALPPLKSPLEYFPNLFSQPFDQNTLKQRLLSVDPQVDLITSAMGLVILDRLGMLITEGFY